MRNLPRGRLTLLFTDIEGSTEMVKRLGPAYAQVQDTHRKILRASFAMHRGREVDTQGDAFFYVFESAADAIAATVAGQRALARHAWPAEIGALKVRMALHTGEPTPTSEGYIGLDVNRAARIGGVGHGGQVLLSATTVAETADALPEGVGLVDLGRHWLKDLAAPEALQRLVIAGLDDVDRPPSSLSSPGLEQRIRVEDAGDADADDDGDRAGDGDGMAPGAGSAGARPERDLPSLLEALRRTVLDERVGIRLSSAELDRIVRHAPADVEAYRLARVAEWSQPRFGLDERFVALTLLLDPEGEGEQVGWAAQPSRHQALEAALAAARSPVLVLLGPPGSGKSTLLRQFELSLALAALRAARSTAEAEGSTPISWFVSLNAFREADQMPKAWLSERWRQRHPDLPSLDALLDEGRLFLLLDGLNEQPSSGEAERRGQMARWRDFAAEVGRRHPGNRILFSCRTLDYSTPLSSPSLPVPRLRVEPMDDAQVQRFLGLHCPGIVGSVWQQLAGTPTLELLRAPFFLALMVEQILESGGIPRGRAGLFTDFVRRAIQREVRRENPLFMPDGLLSARDHRKLLAAVSSAPGGGASASKRGGEDRRRTRPFALPDRGLLVPQLEALAYAMQAQERAGAQKLRIEVDEALDLLDPERGEDLLAAGVALSVLEEDLERDEILFSHPLLQEYFAARRLAGRARDSEGAGRLEAMTSAWRIADIEPPLREALETARAAEPMPALPSTGWEESAKMAAAMAPDPEAFVRALMPIDLALAGECAIQPELGPERVAGALDALRQALLARTEDPAADLRARIQASRVLAEMGDPRLPRRAGAEGASYLEPALCRVPAGRYPMGDEDPPARPDEAPRHAVEIEAFEIGRFPVTNAEWEAFMDAGGYADERWWPEGPAAAWREGKGSMDGQKQNWRQWWRSFRADPTQLEAMAERGALAEDQAEEWRAHVALDEAAFETVLAAYFPEQRYTEPRAWRQRAFNHPSQPVVGICYYEAQAYCRWISASSERGYRLPSEAQWAAAARGPSGLRYAWGDEFDPLRGNVGPTRWRATTPVGVFPEGRSAQGVDDLSGNGFEWTRSLYGRADGKPDFAYPYRADDGREDEGAPASVLRVARGGSWADGPDTARCAYRYPLHPALRHITVGFRLLRYS